MDGLQTTPDTWTAADLAVTRDWIVDVDSTWLAELHAAVERVKSRPPGVIRPDQFPLPTFGPRLTQIADQLEHGPGIALIRGLDVENLTQSQRESMFLGLAGYLGTPVSQSAAGDLVFSVRDAGLPADDPRTRGPNTNRKLSFHTDRCDVIAFLCLQQAQSGGENQVVSSTSLYNQILRRRPDLLEVLRQPFLYKRHNVDSGNRLAFCEQPVFSFTEGRFACAFLRVLIDRAYADSTTPDMTPLQREALDFLEAVAAEPGMAIEFRQEPGDLLLLNNWVTLHRRTAFEDWPEPAKRRHILRIWLSMPNSRPLDPAFAAQYGNVAAGAVRGGMRPARQPPV